MACPDCYSVVGSVTLSERLKVDFFPLVSILIPNPEPNFWSTTELKNILASKIKKSHE